MSPPSSPHSATPPADLPGPGSAPGSAAGSANQDPHHKHGQSHQEIGANDAARAPDARDLRQIEIVAIFARRRPQQGHTLFVGADLGAVQRGMRGLDQALHIPFKGPIRSAEHLRGAQAFFFQ